MKLSAVSLLVAGLALQAAASPIRLLEPNFRIEKSSEFVGHSDAHVIPVGFEQHGMVHITTFKLPVEGKPVHAHHAHAHEHKHAKGRCAKSKAIQISNWFRERLGMPLIEVAAHPHPHPAHKHHHHHHQAKEGEMVAEMAMGEVHHGHHHLAHGDFHAKGRLGHFQEGGFPHRLQRALLSLGPWEGRIMAFVIGCGVGVLIRMFWVLTVVLFRAISAARRARQEQAETIFLFADESEAENLLVPSPQYIVVDEKVVPLAEAQA